MTFDARRFFAPVLCVLAMMPLSSCEAPADQPDPVIVDEFACTRSQCSQHGECTTQDLRPVCECDAGYEGVSCGQCADGFHRDAADACVEDDVCADDSCGAGECSIVAGRLTCTCPVGVAGPACTQCAAGFHDDAGVCVQDERCLDNTCSRQGTCDDTTGVVVCSCDPGFGGRFCDVDEAGNQTCPDVDNGGVEPCGIGGTCNDSSGRLRCDCDTGYTGAQCEVCYPGYVDDGTGACVLSAACAATTCFNAGECSLDNGAISCACFTGFAGDFCDTCADGFHRNTNNDCVVDESCADADPCAAGGTCNDSSGVRVCVCDDGFAGSLCEQCYPGYHDDGTGACVLDERCREATCGLGGACDDAGGVISCTCAPGFEGAHCEVNIDDCVNNACGTGRCLDLVQEATCHCNDGTFGTSCP